MENTNRYFTEAIVGPAMVLTLGVPTAESGEPKWWMHTVSKPKNEPAELASEPVPAKNSVRRQYWPIAISKPHWRAWPWRLIAGGLSASALILAGGIWWVQQANEQPIKKAVIPAQDGSVQLPPLSSITMEKTDFSGSPGEPQSAHPDATVPIFAAPPIAIAQLPGNAPVALPAAVAPAKPKEQKAPAKPKEQKEDRVAALVLDKPEEKPKTPVAVEIKPTPPLAQPKNLVGPSTKDTAIKPSANVTAPTPSREAQATITVVDIDKDGKYVLLSNPTTRLPEKFTVGQKIYTGETIVGINPATGKVQLDSRSIGMQ